MHFGFFTFRPTLRGALLRSIAAATSLFLAIPAHADRVGRESNSEGQTNPAPAAGRASTSLSTLAAVRVSPPSNGLSGTPDNTDGNTLSAGTDEHEEPDPELADAEVTDEELDEEAELAEEDASEDEDSNVVMLPNVEESDLDSADGSEAPQYSPEELAALGDLWERMRAGFQMDTDLDNDRITVQRDWYLRNAGYLDRMARRASRYLYYTVSEAEKRDLPTELALLPIIESAYDPFAYSHADAGGMWQFIPGTARIMGLKLNDWFDGRRDVIESTRAAYDFLSLLYGKFGDWQLALAAYNAGPGAVQRAINRNQAAGLPTDFWSLRLPAETRAYVPRFLAVAQLIKSPATYGVSLRPVLNQPFFRVVEVPGQVDLTEAADIAGISLKEMYQLNGGFKRQVTDPQGPHRLLVPAALPMDFEADLAALSTPELVVARSYKVKRGDTLSAVSRRFGVHTAELKRLNNLKGNTLVAGRTLTITQSNVSPEFVALNKELRLDRSSEPSSRRTASRYYRVKRGDTLSTIARRYGMPLSTLARMNGLSTKSKVRVGQRLALKGTAAKSRQRLASSQSRKSGMRKIRYKVRHGDTLSSISRRYNVSVSEIQRWNGSDDVIHPGQGLVLYVAGGDKKSL